MKRIRCPKCNNYIVFDETKYQGEKTLVFQCTECGKQFGIKLKEKNVGSIVVIENVFHYKQEFPLHMGDNVIGRYMKDSRCHCPIRTDDPSIDMNHCVINVSKGDDGQLKYILRDGPSYTGTFVDNKILCDKERRIISDGTLFTIGATSIILKEPEG